MRKSTTTKFHPYWDGISGALVARLELPGGAVVYKEGSRQKIESEVVKSFEWERVLAGVTPRIIGTTSLEDREALLREFVQGQLLDEVLLSRAPLATKASILHDLLAILLTVWRATLVNTPPRITYTAQVRERLAEVYSLHPELATVAKVGRNRTPLDLLLRKAEAREPRDTPPFSVWLHGDFNANNVVVSGESGQLKFIDVHRSCQGDYVGDIAVFVVSLERRADPTLRRHELRYFQRLVLDAAAAFGADYDDKHFDRRMTLALARSCITSARIVVDDAVAGRLFRRGVRLMAAYGSAA